MNMQLIDKLEKEGILSEEEFVTLLDTYTKEDAEYAKDKARNIADSVYGNEVYIRGLIEFTNYCKNDCYYCGIRRSNINANRYRLTKEDILECCKEGYALGFRTFVLQGGEDPYFTDEVVSSIVLKIKSLYPDAAVTLSLGERSYESYERLRRAGADRYLLRHETACEALYSRLHPKEMSYSNRIKCLEDLKRLGYQVGCGFMVGAPYQTAKEIAKDLKFIEEFKPDMCGIGPFIPHKKSIFADFAAGGVELTCYLLSIIRLILPAGQGSM